ncbi:Flp pilus assembly protein CpaB [Streptomyces sp. NPDC005395]|jgi:pilus assembly protein CpaB|uniref:Flp pilus assembly protein CpaB n=1 Tax=Streptomyces salinarius TaxID=2762598 RepID=A0ABW8BLD6_9ACTN|nr:MULTISPECIES: Flp pilus assembly protein CpaB [Streptomyces]WSU01595.1 Flp pilus assembly protein CpaB [Streptomyces sp. NBC_01124]AZM75828.1 Flp pilus assembly protein CpaB [Streptomyces sp. KPB2]MBH5134303.1 Flp pilus assembly protein CpaB [Streptomyces sp. HB-N217]MCV2464115.1 Flp pilus assembly protein CpaB [Streptomyces sp. ICN988]MDU0255954.1 Flp pilus assembly protein CpaB [Streptomyces sp. PU10]
MNSRQRRGIILLILSVLCALGAFAGVLSVINDVKSKVGPEVTAYRLKSDIEPYTELGAAQFEKIEMPERWLSENAVTDLSQVRGKIAVTKLKAGSLLQTDMIVDTPALRPGQQEVAIMIDAATGVAGKITPGATVNVYATFEGQREGDPDQSKIIVTNAKVIDVGELTSLEPDEDSREREPTDAVPITFALSTIDAQRITYAESFARRVRLALVAPGGDTTVPDKDRTYELAKDK